MRGAPHSFEPGDKAVDASPEFSGELIPSTAGEEGDIVDGMPGPLEVTES